MTEPTGADAGGPTQWRPDAQKLGALVSWLDDAATIGQAPPPDLMWSWRHMPRERALQAWFELLDWVEWLRYRYNLAQGQISGCWYRHPPAVEQLWALYVSHRKAFPPGSGPEDWRDDLTAWHTQWLWPCIKQLATTGYMADCDIQKCHYSHDFAPPLFHDETGGIEEYIAADLTDRPETPAPESAEAQPVMSAAEMSRAVIAGLAEPIDPNDPDLTVSYEDGIWDFDEANELYRRRPDPGSPPPP
ncbi:hypothetical protein [Nocardia sp. CA-120079]|uniref:hypothetical protein n=1 Tax=Nocardia sp. CA-120079 TaxID=3239974 RepID=UPI003D964B7A